jgi:proliferating cell nuclear antigen
MFKVTISDVSLIRDSIDTISQLIGEGIFNLSKNGISLVATDRAMVAVVRFDLKKDAFDEYKCDKDTSIGINIENLLQILRRAKSTDQITLEVSSDNSKLKIEMKGEGTRRFSIPLLDISKGEIPEIDQLDFSSKMQLKTSVMEEGISDADIISDSVIFETDGKNLVIKTEGDSSSVESKIDKKSGLVEISGDNVRSRYALEYLKKMIKAGKISETASLQMGRDFPMKLEFNLPDKVSMSFVLAPRVED